MDIPLFFQHPSWNEQFRNTERKPLHYPLRNDRHLPVFYMSHSISPDWRPLGSRKFSLLPLSFREAPSGTRNSEILHFTSLSPPPFREVEATGRWNTEIQVNCIYRASRRAVGIRNPEIPPSEILHFTCSSGGPRDGSRNTE